MKSGIFLLCLLSAIILLLIYFPSPEQPKEFTGYVVCKEYIPYHYSNQTPSPQSWDGPGTAFKLSVFIPRPIIVPHRANNPTFIKSQFFWYVANKDEVLKHPVDSVMFDTRECGDKVTILFKPN